MERSRKNFDPDKNVFYIKKPIFAPVYVKRTEIPPGTPFDIRESCTQTSKTIIELAKLESGYISPDSLNGTPRKLEKTEILRPVKKQWNYGQDTSYTTDSTENSLKEIGSVKNKKLDVWHAQIHPPPVETAMVIRQDNPKPTSLIEQYFSQKAQKDKKRSRSPFYLKKLNSFKSNSYIEPPSKLLLKKPTKPNSSSPKIGEGEFTKRSNSFMSPTLASQKKSLQSKVEGVKNLVGHTAKGRAVSPRKKKEEIKIPYIDESKANLKAKSTKSDDNYQLSSSTTSVLAGSNASSDNGLFIILNHIKSPDWNFALKGLADIIELARHGDPEFFFPLMTGVNQRLLELLRSPRSHVCRTACQIAGHLFETMKDTRRPEFDDIVNVLLNKCADATRFIRQDANLALDCMVTHIPTFHAIRSLCAKGPTHRNHLVRCATVRLLICAVVIAGPSILLNNPTYEHSRKRIILNLCLFLEDKNQEARRYAERLYKILVKESSFEYHLKKYLDNRGLESFNNALKFIKKR